MEDAGASNQESGLVYEDQMPLAWEQLPADPDPAAIPAIHQSNELLLRCLTAFDESRLEAIDEDHGPLAHDIARLDFKLNLLLDMVGQLLRAQRPAPAAVSVRISAGGLQWRAHRAPDNGSPVRIELFLSRSIPSPIVLHGRVAAVVAEGDGRRIEVLFGQISEPMRNWLEKLIFRQHRRQVAHARRATRERGE